MIEILEFYNPAEGDCHRCDKWLHSVFLKAFVDEEYPTKYPDDAKELDFDSEDNSIKFCPQFCPWCGANLDGFLDSAHIFLSDSEREELLQECRELSEEIP